jgi:hypothetical protein
MMWFGPSWHAPVCTETDHVETPKAPCAGCGENFTPIDYGVILPCLGEPGDVLSEMGYHHRCIMAALGLPVTIHVLHHGFPICGFTREMPKDWPQGHLWVRKDDAALATCPRCRGSV